MNVLSDTYIFYADVYFIQNFIIKAAVIYLSLYCNKLFSAIDTMKGIGKILLASLLGTILEIIGLLLGNSYHLVLLAVHLLEIPCMIWLVHGKERKHMLRVIITGYFFIIVINGVLEILWNWMGDYGYYVFYLCAACGIVYAGVRMFLNYHKMTKGIFQVELRQGERQVTAYGLYDTGNHLQDPHTGSGVHIVSEKLIQQLQMEGKKAVYIPFQSLGKEQGLLPIYYIEYIRIRKNQNWIEKLKVPIGVAEDKLFEDKKYQMILNEELEL